MVPQNMNDKNKNDNLWNEEPSPPDERPVPEGFPERPDAKKVNALRKQMKDERSARKTTNNNRPESKFSEKFGKRARDIGSLTLIPMIMLAGPIVGYGVGWLMEKQLGGAPWTGVIGLLMGVIASFRQVIIILSKKAKADKREGRN